jgi:hypothetical protein
VAQTIGQHGVAAFTSPVNGDLLNATVVLSNDNTTRSAYVDHDIDSGIHVQSSLLAARPVAGTAGRKWMTTDTGAVKLWFDTGVAWEEIAYLPSAGGTVAGNVSVTGTLGVTGLITATGGVSGNVTGAVTGNASTATTLQTSRNINGVAFNGSADITITAVAAAGSLTGATLASNVLASSLTSVGALNAGSISSGFGAIDIGTDAFTGAGTGLTGTAAGLTAGGNAVLGANTFTAAQEWATGTSIASAATINLDTATGNRVHITGTTAITAVTLTRGPRTVIFDGILTLTHNATTNNLPSAANITTAVGDRAVYESDGTTVYCVSYTRVTGQALVAAAVPASPVNYPQSIKSVDYTLVLGDAGYQIFHPASDTAARVFTIPANSSVAYPIGTVLVFVNEIGAKGLSVEITTDTLRSTLLTTGTQKVPAGNMLTAMKIAATTWLCWPATPLSLSRAVAIGNNAQLLAAYSWSSAGGFGTKYVDPATAVSGTVRGIAFSPAGTEIVVGHGGTPFVSAYPWSGSGFGVKFANPATLPPNSVYGAAISPSGTEIAVAHFSSPFFSAYSFSSAGFGTKYTDPATLPTNACRGVAFSPTAIAGAHFGSPTISAYPWSSAGFGTKYADPATLPSSTDANGVAFSPAGTEIAVAHADSPFVSAYPFSGSGFGTKFTNPATLPTGTGYAVAFSPAGTELAVGHFLSPFVSAYPWSSAGFGTKFANPATGVLASSVVYSVAFSPTGTEIVTGHDAAPYVSSYSWSSAGFGTKYAGPATALTSSSLAVAFSPI